MMEQPTSLLHVTAEVVREKEDVATMSLMTEYLEKYQIHPKVVVADQAFMTRQVEAYCNRQNIKHQLRLMLQTTHEGYEPFNGIVMKYGNLVRQACLAKYSSVTYGGVTPLELAFGRRPRDLLSHLSILSQTSSPVILLIRK